jgi:hypothetical protein
MIGYIFGCVLFDDKLRISTQETCTFLMYDLETALIPLPGK